MIYGIMLKEIKKQLSEKYSAIVSLLIPMIIVLVIYGLIMSTGGQGSKIIVHYTKENEEFNIRDFINSLEENKIIEMKEINFDKKSYLIKEIEKGEANFLLVFEENKEIKKKNINFFYNEKADGIGLGEIIKQDLEKTNRNLKEVKLENYVLKFETNEELAKQIIDTDFKINIEKKQALSPEERYAIIAIGYIVFFSLFTISKVGTSISREREDGMLARINSTKVTKYHYIIGMTLPSFLMHFTNIIVLFLVFSLALKLPIENLGAFFLLTLSFSFSVVSLGLFISFISKKMKITSSITSALVFGGSLLSGLMIPLEFLPKVVQKIGTKMPHYIIHDGYIGIVIKNEGMKEINTNILILFLIGLVCFISSLLLYEYFKKGMEH